MVVRRILMSLSIVLMVLAMRQHETVAMILAPISAAVLYVPFSRKISPPSWIRYSIYAVLIVVAFVFWDVR